MCVCTPKLGPGWRRGGGGGELEVEVVRETMESDSDGVGWAEQSTAECRSGAARMAMATAIASANRNANGMDAAIQPNPDSGGFPSRCGFDANERKGKQILGAVSALLVLGLFGEWAGP